MKNKNTPKKEKKTHRRTLRIMRPIFWFAVGMFFASFCLATFFLIYFRTTFKNRVIPGVFVGNVYVGEKTQQEVENIFKNKNKKLAGIPITFTTEDNIATFSAQDLNVGFDATLMAQQAESIGKNADVISNTYYIINSYLNGTYLPPSYTTNIQNVQKLLAQIEKKIHVEPVNAVFQVQNNKVVTFKQSSNGKSIDYDALEKILAEQLPGVIQGKTKNLKISVPIRVLKPAIPTEKANKLGIVEEIGQGTSLFAHSIPGRIHNVALAASKINGVLIAPGEEFSFDKNLGDVSQYTGYQQAYVIQNGKTVLGDGGGVCQVSTTLFRAALNAGLPITDRTAHAYRVGYYEQDSPPGLDATVYYPTVDLKFKNDTKNYILIVETIDLNSLRLTFTLYGKKDGRQVAITTPVITSQTPAPADVYQDDPTLPKGQIKQVDFAAAGAVVSFSRTVTKDGKTVSNTYRSVYRPWQAIFLRGTKEG